MQTATDSTRNTASEVLNASENLFEQERNLNALRDDIANFLTDLRKTG